MNSQRPLLFSAMLWLCVSAVASAFIFHVSIGAKTLPIGVVLEALVAPEGDVFDHAVVREIRLPRAIFALTVGGALAMAGALMQGVTRNPLAEPGLLGLMAGATFAVVIGIGWLQLSSVASLPLLAAIGALAGTALVWAIATAAPGGARPLTLTLSGAAVTAFLMAIESGAILLNERVFDDFRVWLSGSLAGRDMNTFLWALPWMVAGSLAALAISRSVTILAMGEETAAGLGVDTVRVKAIALMAVVSLTAASVAIAGPLGFVGLVVPHVVRIFVGEDYARIVPFSAVVGAGYLLLVDVAARAALAPVEVSTGIVTAMLGAPIFVWLVWARL